MKGYNVIVVFNKEADKMLMCKRIKEPYKGLSNFVGGKIEAGEDGMDAAYRELFEETSIVREDIKLRTLWILPIIWQRNMLRSTLED